MVFFVYVGFLSLCQVCNSGRSIPFPPFASGNLVLAFITTDGTGPTFHPFPSLLTFLPQNISLPLCGTYRGGNLSFDSPLFFLSPLNRRWSEPSFVKVL